MVISHGLYAQKSEESLEIYEDWRLSKEKEGIKIFTRWIDAGDDRKARQMHAFMTVKASLSSGVLALSDADQVKQWLNRAETYYHFDLENEFNWFAYTEFKIPWPLDNQDLITRNNLQQDPVSGNVLVTLTGVPDKMPEREGIQRMPHFDGSWEFSKQSTDSLRIDYYIFTRTRPVLPRWIIDPVIEYGLWSTFNEMRKIILENESKKASLPFILR